MFNTKNETYEILDIISEHDKELDLYIFGNYQYLDKIMVNQYEESQSLCKIMLKIKEGQSVCQPLFFIIIFFLKEKNIFWENFNNL